MSQLSAPQPAKPQGLLSRFWQQPHRGYRNFVIIYTLLTLNFAVPAISYYVDPDAAVKSAYHLGEVFGFHAQPASEDSYLWWILGAGNVMTLAVMCALLLVNLPRFYPILPALVTLKGLSSLGFLAVYIFGPHSPTFLIAGLFDGVTVAAMLYFAIRAQREIERDPSGLVPAPINGRRMLRPGTRSKRRIKAVTESMVLPDQPPGDGDSERILQLALDQIGRSPLTTGLGIRGAFRLVFSAPLLVVGRPRTLTKLSPQTKQRYLQKLEHHRLYALRQSFVLVKTVVALAYFGDGSQSQRLGAYQEDALSARPPMPNV